MFHRFVHFFREFLRTWSIVILVDTMFCVVPILVHWQCSCYFHVLPVIFCCCLLFLFSLLFSVVLVSSFFFLFFLLRVFLLFKRIPHQLHRSRGQHQHTIHVVQCCWLGCLFVHKYVHMWRVLVSVCINWFCWSSYIWRWYFYYALKHRNFIVLQCVCCV